MFRVRHLPSPPFAADVDELVSTFFGQEGTTARVRAAVDGFDPDLWRRWVDLGPYDLLDLGDGVGAVTRATSACLTAGEAMAPIPIAETLAAAHLLGRLDVPEALDLRAAMASSADVVVLATRPADEAVLPLVAGGSVAARVLHLHGVTIRCTEDVPGERIPTSGRLPIAHRLAAAGDPVVAHGGAAEAEWANALVVQRLLATGLVLGSARRAHAVAVAYVQERRQFGRTIGSFQSVAHRLADSAAALTGAELLLRAVASELDDGELAPAVLDGRVGLATAFVLRRAEVAVTDALHFHGGYGFTLEEDIHLHVQHIRSLSQLLGGTHAALRRAAPVLAGGRLHR